MWREAIRGAVPRAAGVGRVVDLGCGRRSRASSLQLISDEAFERGRRAFERHCSAAGDRPVGEAVDLFVFTPAAGRPGA